MLKTIIFLIGNTFLRPFWSYIAHNPLNDIISIIDLLLSKCLRFVDIRKHENFKCNEEILILKTHFYDRISFRTLTSHFLN